MDQVKFVEESLKKLKGYGLFNMQTEINKLLFTLWIFQWFYFINEKWTRNISYFLFTFYSINETPAKSF